MRLDPAVVGIQLPDVPTLASAGTALAIVFLGSIVAVFAGRKIGMRLAGFWKHHGESRVEDLRKRMCDLVRYLIAALIFAIALNWDRWPLVSAFILGLPLALSVALLVRSVARGLHMSRWAALLLAAAAFVALLADALNGLEPVTDLLERIAIDTGKTRISLLNLLQIAITLLALYAVVKLAIRVLNQSILRIGGLDPTQQLLAQKLGVVALVVVAFFVGIDLIGIDLTALAVFSGAVGLAVGFGLQKTFGNLIAGIILLMDRSIKPGDVIAVGDSFGQVNKIGVRAVSVITRDGKEHLIPNENLMTQEVQNWSYSTPNVRIHIPVRTGYRCDVALAHRLMIDAATRPARVLTAPAPVVWLRAFGDNALEHEIRVWIKDPEAGVGSVQSEILCHLWELFKQHEIEVPYPQRDLRLREWPETAGGDQPVAPSP